MLLNASCRVIGSSMVLSGVLWAVPWLYASEIAPVSTKPATPQGVTQKAADLSPEVPANAESNTVDFLIPDSPLSLAENASAEEEMGFSEEADIFEDLTFHPRLIDRGKIQLSQHETITFGQQKIVAESFGNEVTLNLRDQNLTSETFAGYVLGPFNPRNDYMNVYDDTLGSVSQLIEKAIDREETRDGAESELLGSLKQAQETLAEFQRRTRMLKAKADEEQESLRLMEALREHGQGELPDYEDLRVESQKDSRGNEIRKVILTLPDKKSQDAIHEKIFLLKLAREEYQVVETVEQGAGGQTMLNERYDYDAGRQLRRVESKSYYPDGTIRADREERYDSGIRQSRYREEFSPGGQKTRLLREIFYEDGTLKSTTDFDYLKGQKHSYLFSSDGQAISSNIEPILS